MYAYECTSVYIYIYVCVCVVQYVSVEQGICSTVPEFDDDPNVARDPIFQVEFLTVDKILTKFFQRFILGVAWPTQLVQCGLLFIGCHSHDGKSLASYLPPYFSISLSFVIIGLDSLLYYCTQPAHVTTPMGVRRSPSTSMMTGT